MKTIRVLDSTGDTVVNFDDPALAEDARTKATADAKALFERLTGGGAAAFAVKRENGQPDMKITRFDQIEGETVIVPRIVAG